MEEVIEEILAGIGLEKKHLDKCAIEGDVGNGVSNEAGDSRKE